MAVVTIPIATTSDEAYIEAATDTGATTVNANAQQVKSGLYIVGTPNHYEKYRALARWFVSIPADATVTSANFIFRPTARSTGLNTVYLQGYYYTHDGSIELSDWDAAEGAQAFTIDQDSFTLSADNTVALSNINNIPKNGYVGFRFRHDHEIYGTQSSLTWTAGTTSTTCPRLQIRYTRVSAPTNLAPTTPFNRQATTRFSWQHNEAGGGAQGAFTLSYRTSPTGSWSNVVQTTSNNYYDMPSGTIGSSVDIDWKVKTADSAGDYGAESSIVTVRAGAAASTPNITAPTGTITNAQPTVTWTSSGQVSYRLRVIKVSDSSVAWDSGEVVSASTSRLLGIVLADDTQYQIKLSIKNSDGVWSAEDSETITTNLTNPPTPSLTLTPHASAGYIELAISNPSPGGGEPALVENQVYRRIEGESVFKRIKRSLGDDATWRDYGAPSAVDIEYYVRAVGDNGAVADSSIETDSYTLAGLWLHDVRDPQNTVINLDALNAGVDDVETLEVSLKKYLGRSGDVAVFGRYSKTNFKITFIIKSASGEWEAYKDLIARRSTLCVRIPTAGDVYFGAVVQRPRQFDQTMQTYTVALELSGTGYTEEI